MCERIPGGERGYTGANRRADVNILKQIESRQLYTSVVEASRPCYRVEVYSGWRWRPISQAYAISCPHESYGSLDCQWRRDVCAIVCVCVCGVQILSKNSAVKQRLGLQAP